MTTLTYGATTLTLPDDLLWTDEFTWQSVEQRSEYSITGALIVEASAKQSGRTITLAGDDQSGWVLRSTLTTLHTWSQLPAQAFTLVLRGDTFTVAFDQPRTAVDARAVVDYSDPDGTDYYVPTLRFIEV